MHYKNQEGKRKQMVDSVKILIALAVGSGFALLFIVGLDLSCK